MKVLVKSARKEVQVKGHCILRVWSILFELCRFTFLTKMDFITDQHINAVRIIANFYCKYFLNLIETSEFDSLYD